MWPFSYIRGLLERRIVEPLAKKYITQYEERVAEAEVRLEKSIESHKANAKADLTALVDSAAAGLIQKFQDLKTNFGYLSEQFDKHLKTVDEHIAEYQAKMDDALKNVASLMESSAANVSDAEASYGAAKTALEETRIALQSARKEIMDLQNTHNRHYDEVVAASQETKDALEVLEAKVDEWSTRAHELLSIDLTAERLERAEEGGIKLLECINAAKTGIKEDVLVSVKTDVSSLGSALSEKLREVADERAYLMLTYCLRIPENRRSIVSWIVDYGGNYEAVRRQLKDGNARAWLERFEKDVKQYGMNLKYLDAIVRLLSPGRKRI